LPYEQQRASQPKMFTWTHVCIILFQIALLAIISVVPAVLSGGVMLFVSYCLSKVKFFAKIGFFALFLAMVIAGSTKGFDMASDLARDESLQREKDVEYWRSHKDIEPIPCSLYSDGEEFERCAANFWNFCYHHHRSRALLAHPSSEETMDRLQFTLNYSQLVYGSLRWMYGLGFWNPMVNDPRKVCAHSYVFLEMRNVLNGTYDVEKCLSYTMNGMTDAYADKSYGALCSAYMSDDAYALPTPVLPFHANERRGRGNHNHHSHLHSKFASRLEGLTIEGDDDDDDAEKPSQQQSETEETFDHTTNVLKRFYRSAGSFLASNFGFSEWFKFCSSVTIYVINQIWGYVTLANTISTTSSFVLMTCSTTADALYRSVNGYAV